MKSLADTLDSGETTTSLVWTPVLESRPVGTRYWPPLAKRSEYLSIRPSLLTLKSGNSWVVSLLLESIAKKKGGGLVFERENEIWVLASSNNIIIIAYIKLCEIIERN